MKISRKQKEAEIEQELQEGAGVVEHVAVAKTKEEPKVKAANEFEDEYTLNVIADYDPNADIFRIPLKDPNYAYRWLVEDKKRLAITTGNLLTQRGGWQFCPQAHLKRIGLEDRIAADGFARVGEHILAFMPMELYKKKEAAKQHKTDTRTNAINRIVTEGDPSVGGASMHHTMKGIRKGRMDGGKVVFD